MVSFYLELSEWNNICITNSSGITSLVSNWSIVFQINLKIKPQCVF